MCLPIIKFEFNQSANHSSSFRYLLWLFWVELNLTARSSKRAENETAAGLHCKTEAKLGLTGGIVARQGDQLAVG